MQKVRNVTQKFSRGKSYDITTISGEVDDKCTKEQINSKGFGLGFRHLVAFYCFMYFGIVNSHIAVIGITMVAMVNHTHISLSLTKNTTLQSCPAPGVPEDVATPKLEGSFDWDAQTQGTILGLSKLGFILCTFFAGRIGERFGAKRTIIVADLFSNFFTSLTPTAAYWGPYALTVVLVVRLFFQGFILPCVFIMMANWFPRRERGLLSSFATCGVSVGSCVTGLVAWKLCAIPSMRWPSAYYLLGGVNLTLTLTFVFFYYEVPKLHPRISKAELDYITGDQESDMSLKRPPAPWKAIFTSVPVYAFLIGKFGFYWAFLAHFLIMHPTYIYTVLHFSMNQNGLFTCLLFFIMTVSSVISMTASFWLRQKNVLGVNNLRKGFSLISSLGSCLCLLGVSFAGCDAKLNVILCCLAQFFGGMGFCGAMIVNGDMSPKFSGFLAGISSAVACLSLVIMPFVVGSMTKHETLEEWRSVFHMDFAVIATCGIIFQVFGSAEIQPFNSVTSTTEEKTQPATQLQPKCAETPNNIHI